MRAVGIILAGGNSRRMKELTAKRAAAAMPVAGSYRAIDFALSNMTNSHIQKVAVLTQYNARSLNEHLNSSKWWDFGRKQGGLYVFTPTITADNGYWYRGTADAIYQNLDFLRKCHEPYVIITSGDAVYKMDYNKVLEYHIAKKADITVVCKELEPGEDATRFGTIRMNESARIEEFEEKPMVAHSQTISTGIYVIRRRQLIDLVEHCAEEERHDFVTDILIRYEVCPSYSPCYRMQIVHPVSQVFHESQCRSPIKQHQIPPRRIVERKRLPRKEMQRCRPLYFHAFKIFFIRGQAAAAQLPCH